MSCMLTFLLCYMAGFWLCVADQGRPSCHVHYKHRTEQRLQRPSRKHCDPSYNNQTAGAITQRCGPGQYRERWGQYRGQCVPCNCNGLSHECDQNTGKCQHCQLNTAGDHCERCAEGYYGNAVLRTCQVCPCPLSKPSQSFALGCLRVGDQLECLCKPGYSGTRCERCSAGYYGDPLQDGGSCQLCACNDGYLCDPFTGECKDPNNPSPDGDCQECDGCIQTLMEDLEWMDFTLYTLKAELERFKNNSTSLTALWELEDTINTTKVLVENYIFSVQVLGPKVKELEADLNGVNDDLRKLRAKANLTSVVTSELLKDLNQTQEKGKDLLTNTEELQKKIEELLERLKASNTTLPSNEISRMLEEARRMVAQMQRQNCSAQRRLAEDEFREAKKLLDYIMKNLSDPLNGALATTDQIAQDLMSQVADLKDLEDVLKTAEKTINKIKLMNGRSEATLSDILERRKMFEEEQDTISADLAMTQGTLKNISELSLMLEDQRNDFAKLAAELDGAQTDVKRKLNELSKASALETIVRQAEEHAQYLMDLAMQFDMSLLNYTNASAVHMAVEAVGAYGDVIDALKKAEAAAEEAHEAAGQALEDVKAQNLTQKADELKNTAIILTEVAMEAVSTLTEATQQYVAIKDRLDKAVGKLKRFKDQIQVIEEEMNRIKKDDIDTLLNEAKDAVQGANNTVSSATAKLKDINADLDKIRFLTGDSNMDNILNSVNKTLNELNKVFPTLTDTLAEVETQSSRVPDRTNLSDSIMRIKDIIKSTRDMANRVRGPILFSGNSHIELRPPNNLEDLRAFTALNLTLHRPQPDQRSRRQSIEEGDNLFVFYMGNKHPPKELQYPSFKGCIEFSTLNEHILGLYNFQNAVNIKKTDKCLRGEAPQVCQYFDGTGYGRVNVAGSSKSIKFFVLSRQENTLLFYMGNKDSYFTITVEEGFVVLQIRNGNQTLTKKSNAPVFPRKDYQQIRIFQKTTTEVQVNSFSVNVLLDYKNLHTAETEAFVGGVPAATSARHNISYPSLRGCLTSLEVDVNVRFTEEVGIVRGCPLDLLGLREASVELGSSLAFTPNITSSNTETMVSLGFMSTQSSGVLLHTGNEENWFELSLVGGHVEMKDTTSILKSEKRYDEGGWHYVTAFRNSSGMELSIDNSDKVEKQTPAPAIAPTDVHIVLGQETFQGCLRNFYMRGLVDTYIPTDLSNFNQTGPLYLGPCKAQRPPLVISEKSSLKRRGTVKWPKVQKNFSQPECPKSEGLIQAYHLSASSQLQYVILPEELNFRPHFSLDVRTRSANGLLLHAADKEGVSRIVLFIANGRVKLYVGEKGLLHSQKKINNGDWHNDKPIPTRSVIGCIRDVRFYDVLVGEPAVNQGGAPCFDGAAVEGAYFAGDGSYTVLETYFMLGAEFKLTFEVRPRNMTGLLFHCRGRHGHSLSVFMKKARIVAQMNDGGGDYSASVAPLSPLCDHTFHLVTVTKKGNSIELMVGHDSNRAVGPSVRSHPQVYETLYIGGVPEKKRRRVPVWSSFVGCIRNVQVNQAAVSFQSVSSVFGPVNTKECPGD
ncbi:hypothetical protein NFI96_023621 [Prochilodus magdalenae]|nr:hypothetical protein NFI96_023621 [Prochilodus magdalenae]